MIKRFNEYYNVELYTEITHDEWEVAVVGETEHEPFLTSEKEKIVHALKVLGYSNLDIFPIGFNSRHRGGYSVFNLLGDGGISITKIRDEWFYVYDKFHFRFYKCDQFEGLLQCLQKNPDFPPYC